MDWNRPVQVSIPANAPRLARPAALLGHFDTRIYLTPGGYVDIGAGSMSVLNVLTNIPKEIAGKLGEVGRYVEANVSARILVHAEHDHDKPVNVTLSGLLVMEGGYQGGLLPHAPFTIGSGVVISHGATVLSGRQIGDGAVIGAGAVVTKDVGPLQIVAGVPARALRQRKPFAPWWDFETTYILENKDRLQQLAADPSLPHRYRRPKPRLVLSYMDEACQILGFMDGDRLAPPSEFPPKVLDYLTQAVTSPTPYWLADFWPE